MTSPELPMPRPGSQDSKESVQDGLQSSGIGIPGPDLDRLVAEKVMGWTYHPDRHRPDAFTYGFWRSAGCEKDVGADVWSPSLNIAHAWEVVMHMHGHGFAFSIEPHRHAHVALVGCWSRDDHPRGGFHFQGGSDVRTIDPGNLPLAICQAAIKALGGSRV